MLVTSNDIKNDVIVKLGITTTTAFYTDAILDDWIQQAERWATAYRKWPFSEGKQETTYTSANEEWNFEGIKADSIRILQIGGKRFEKVTFEDYQIFKVSPGKITLGSFERKPETSSGRTLKRFAIAETVSPACT